MIKMIQKNMNKKGFTLVELIIVIAVMAILAAIVIPRMTGVTASFKEKADLRTTEMLARQLQVRAQIGDLSNQASFAQVTGTVLGAGETTPVAKVSGNEFYYTYDGTNVVVKCTAAAATVDADNTITVSAAEIK